MAVKTYKIQFWTIGTDVDEKEVKQYVDPTSPRYGQYINPLRDDDGNLPFATAIAIGNGYFLTASHSFDFAAYAKSGEIYRLKAHAAYINDVKIDKTWDHFRGWKFRNTLMTDEQINSQPWDDLTIVSTNLSVSDTEISPFVIFSDAASINNYMSNHKSMSFYGQKSGFSNGDYVNSNISGQFSTSISTLKGDSGGAASISLQGSGTASDYIVGILSHQNPLTNKSVFSYLNTVEFYKILTLPKVGPTNSFQNTKPDLIIDKSGESEKYFRGTEKKATFIIDSNKGAVLLGSGEDSINTGSGTDNIVFLQNAVGKEDDGATIVVSPGNDVIVGGSNNDRIVILADRLWKPSSGQPDASGLKSNSDTIQIRGGMTSPANGEGNKFGLYSPAWNPSQSYDENGYYHVNYDFKNSGGAIDLVITVYAIDGSSDPAPNPHFTTQYSGNLWTSVIRIKNFKEGDFGLKFVEGLFTDRYKDAWNDVERIIPSASTSPQPSKYSNNDISDNWNGIKPETDFPPYDPSSAYIQAQLNRILDTYKDGNFTINPGPTNRAPTAGADEKSVSVNGEQVFDLLANDTDPDVGDQINLVSFSLQNISGISDADKRHVSLAFSIENNKLKFSPDNKFDSLEIGQSARIDIKYTIEDRSGYQATGSFVLNIVGENPPAQHGTELADTIYGSNRADTIYGYGGDDFLSAWAGNDILFGGSGDDRIFGHEGDDVLEGGDGNDILDGGTGNDIMRGGNGSDRYHVDSALDQIIEVLDGGTNSITTDLSSYVLVPNTHNMTYLGISSFIGRGNELDNNITGGEQNDQLDGGAGNDVLRGLGGNDIFYGGLGSDLYDGGSGFDTVDYFNSSNAVVVDILNSNNNFGNSSGDIFVSIEQWGLSAYDDRFVGSDDADYVFALGGSDTLLGGGGDDWLAGGEGADILDGQDGFDTADYTGASAAVTVDRITAANSLGDAEGDTFTSIERFHLSQYDDRFVGSSANEFIYGNGGNDTLLGGDGNDWLIGGAGADALMGGNGYDTASYFSANAAVTIDLVTVSNSVGDAEGDTFSTIEAFQLTANYADRFVGSSASEMVFGGGGNDTLIGNDGNDFLDGEEMNDVLTGGAGTDTFAFYERGFGKDVVTDFVNGDLIEFSNSAFSSFTAIQSSMSQVGSDTIITLDNDNMVTLLNVIATNLIATDFKFV